MAKEPNNVPTFDEFCYWLSTQKYRNYTDFLDFIEQHKKDLDNDAGIGQIVDLINRVYADSSERYKKDVLIKTARSKWKYYENSKKAKKSLETRAKPASTSEIRLFFGVAIVVINIFIIISGWSSDNYSNYLGVAILLSVASLIVGCVFGFIFGIPKSHSQSDTVASTEVADASVSRQINGADRVNATPGEQIETSGGTGKTLQTNIKTTRPQIVANTNLEQISDWLAKVIVGIGLTQLNDLSQKIMQAGEHLKAAFSPVKNGDIIGVSIIIAFFLIGFLWFFLESRTLLMRIFSDTTSNLDVNDNQTY